MNSCTCNQHNAACRLVLMLLHTFDHSIQCSNVVISRQARSASSTDGAGIIHMDVACWAVGKTVPGRDQGYDAIESMELHTSSDM